MALGFFTPSGNPNVDMETRRKIALAMMAQGRRKTPTNLGEGIASIGQEIGDALTMRALLEDSAASNVAADKVLEKYTGTPRAEAEPAQRTTYAPPDSTPPAVAAINSAAPQGPPIVPAPPPRARTITPPTAPSGGAAPVTAGPGGMIEPGEFNEIDAADPRNRYRAPPAYLAPALERNIADPERRGYLGQLAGKEAQSAGEVSSTGAAGPFQFTRGTGAQYGIPGNARFDPDASTRAVNAFTNDNVAALTAKLGREPTPGEMALAHQQGAGTAGNMLTGAENAPARNLAVNNVPAGLGPQAAAQKVMGYYGMPGAAGVPASPRDGVTAALTAQQNGRPSVADYGQPMALATTPQQAIPAAPPQQQIRAAPQQQVAQANPLVPPIPPELANLTPPRTMTDDQRKMLRDVQAAPPAHREAIQKALKPLWDQEQAKITQEHEIYREKLAVKRAIETEQYKLTAGAPKTAADIAHVNQQTATGNIIEMPDGNKYRQDPATGKLKPIEIEGVPADAEPPLPKNDFQSKSLKHYQQMQKAEKDIGEGKALRHGLSATGSQVPIVGGYLQTDAYRQERSAAERWVINKLRQESGADVKETELNREVKAYFPQPSDDAKTIADKNAARKIATEGMKEASGREGKKYLEWKERRAAAEIADAVQWLKDNKDDPRAAGIRKRLGL